MSDDNTDDHENPFSFKHFIKNKKETQNLDSPDKNISVSSITQEGSKDVHVKINELPFPEVSETTAKKRTKGIVILESI